MFIYLLNEYICGIELYGQAIKSVVQVKKEALFSINRMKIMIEEDTCGTRLDLSFRPGLDFSNFKILRKQINF